MKTSTAIAQAGLFAYADLPANIALYPYFDSGKPKSRKQHHLIAGAQQLANQHRKSDFDARLRELRSRGETLRSFPTDAGSISWPLEGQAGSQEVLSYIEQVSRPHANGHVATPASDVMVQGPSDDPYPFEAPPIDASAFGGIEVDPEYDQGMALHPAGEEGQPDVYDWSDATIGNITKIGFFPFRFKQGEKKTHMIRIGTKDHWGVDLERVVREFNLREGDKIALMSIGKHPVVVKERVRQDDGSYKTEDKNAMRNTWVCKRVQ